jgi:hypothetical protein
LLAKGPHLLLKERPVFGHEGPYLADAAAGRRPDLSLKTRVDAYLCPELLFKGGVPPAERLELVPQWPKLLTQVLGDWRRRGLS